MEMSVSIKKNARTPTKTATAMLAGESVMESAMMDSIIVPIIPTIRETVLEHRHLDNVDDDVTAEKTTMAIKTIRAKTAIPNAIQTAIVIEGIKLKKKRTPTKIAASNAI